MTASKRTKRTHNHPLRRAQHTFLSPSSCSSSLIGFLLHLHRQSPFVFEGMLALHPPAPHRPNQTTPKTGRHSVSTGLKRIKACENRQKANQKKRARAVNRPIPSLGWSGLPRARRPQTTQRRDDEDERRDGTQYANTGPIGSTL